jgi:hypothetical protein
VTAECLRYYATRLGNSFWCRHWLHWNYPEREPWLMAISCRDGSGVPIRAGLEAHGFAHLNHDGLHVYTVPRTDETGLPFRSPS